MTLTPKDYPDYFDIVIWFSLFAVGYICGKIF